MYENFVIDIFVAVYWGCRDFERYLENNSSRRTKHQFATRATQEVVCYFARVTW